MNPFSYTRVKTGGEAALAISAAGVKLLGGGTNLIDLMKSDVEQPTELVDINHIGLNTVFEETDTVSSPTSVKGGVRIGALVRNSDLANHPLIVERYPLLSHALLAGASPQLRNRATTGGNLMQRTRCYYFADTAFPACNKRAPGSGCAAVNGFNRIHAILGQTDEGPMSPHTCIATHPSDMCVALYALGAKVDVVSVEGQRRIPIEEFHRLPGDDPAKDTVLKPNELIVAVVLPPTKFAKNSWYLKARDRQSYAFALVSVAAGLEMDGNTIKSAGLTLGGVAHKPWRVHEAEVLLVGNAATRETFTQAAELMVKGAKTYEHKPFNEELAKQCVVKALMQAANGVTA